MKLRHRFAFSTNHAAWPDPLWFVHRKGKRAWENDGMSARELERTSHEVAALHSVAWSRWTHTCRKRERERKLKVNIYLYMNKPLKEMLYRSIKPIKICLIWWSYCAKSEHNSKRILALIYQKRADGQRNITMAEEDESLGRGGRRQPAAREELHAPRVRHVLLRAADIVVDHHQRGQGIE